MKKNNFLILPLLFFAGVVAVLGASKVFIKNAALLKPTTTPEEIAGHYTPTPTPIKSGPTSTPTPTPTPKLLTFAEMNALYGPCVHLPVLMYHHIQSQDAAKEKNQTNLTVTPEYLRSHLEYLKLKGYHTIYMSDLVNFFDQGTPIPPKSVLLTFDDGYDDFATNALPILRELGFKGTVFIPTGLMDNPGYLSWATVADIASAGDIMFSNHTWSHRNMGSNQDAITREITTAGTQLAERNLNSPKVFAYPYGLESTLAKDVIESLEYKLAFGTKSGGAQCKKQRFDLQRIRVGNATLASYGF